MPARRREFFSMQPENQDLTYTNNDDEWQEDLTKKLQFMIDDIPMYTNNLNLIFDTLYASIHENREAQMLGLKYFKVL